VKEKPRVRIPLREREPFLHLRYGLIDRARADLPPPQHVIRSRYTLGMAANTDEIDVQDSAVVISDKNGTRLQVPVGLFACLLLEPGVSITHEAVKICAQEECLLVWCGEGATRFYSAGSPGGARSDKLVWQLSLANDEKKRLRVVREMFRRRFGDDVPDKRSVDQLRGLEGANVKKLYETVAASFGISWKGRSYDPQEWRQSNDINRAISAANACVYGVTEAAILVAGYSPAVGFLHTGRPLSFVYDIADLFKFTVSVPAAFEVVAAKKKDPEGEVRRLLRDRFRKNKTMALLIPTIEDVLMAGEVNVSSNASDAKGTT
jgi:CRISP-associated protein Cas1